MKTHFTVDSIRFAQLSTQQLRDAFLVQDLFQPGQLQLIHTDLDRAIVGSAVPLSAALRLLADEALRAAYFTERRELGILNIGGAGTVSVDGTSYPLGPLDALYVGSGNRDISFSSESSQSPAEFYLVSYPAHVAYLTVLAPLSQQTSAEIGAPETCNQRRLTRIIHLDGIRSAQLVMGYTQLASGCAWNTMPPHTHLRRTEIYLYFNLAAEDRVLHLMGTPQETRHLFVANKQVVLSPNWSIHAGAGTRHYSFCWAMGGENQVFADMDPAPIATLA